MYGRGLPLPLRYVMGRTYMRKEKILLFQGSKERLKRSVARCGGTFLEKQNFEIVWRSKYFQRGLAYRFRCRFEKRMRLIKLRTPVFQRQEHSSGCCFLREVCCSLLYRNAPPDIMNPLWVCACFLCCTQPLPSGRESAAGKCFADSFLL